MRCSLCGGIKTVYVRSSGEYICTNCGNVVFTDNISPEPEWRQFNNDDVDKSRVGSPNTVLIDDKGLGTVMVINMDEMSEQKIRDYTRMRKFDAGTFMMMSPSTRNFNAALDKLYKLGEIFNTPKPIIETAADIYRKILSLGLVRGRSILLITAAALYIAYRLHDKPRPRRDFIRAIKMMRERKVGKGGKVGREKAKLMKPRAEFSSACHLILRNLRIEIPKLNPMFYLRRIAAKMSLKPEVLKTAEEIMRRAKEKRVTAGKNPIGIAAAAIYIAMLRHGISVSQHEIAVASDTTQVTVRNLYNLIRRKLGIECPQPKRIGRRKASETVLV